MLYTEHQQRAQALLRAFRQEQQRILDDGDWTIDAKGRLLAEAEQRYQRAVGALCQEAFETVQRNRRIAEQKLVKARAQDIERRRQLLGDTVLVDLIKTELQASSSEQIAEWYRQASDGWEKEVVAGYGELIVRQRLEADPAPAHAVALRTLETAEPQELRSLHEEVQRAEQAEQAIADGQLDRLHYMTEFAQRMGLRPEIVLAQDAGETE